MMDNELRRSLDKIENQLKRMVEIWEKMSNTPPIDITEPAPFHCPNCGTLEPDIEALTQGAGPSGKFVLRAECLACHHTIYGIPVGWEIFQHADAVRAAQGEIE